MITTSPSHPRRSALFMPASNARAIEKARSLACDVVILDLEDAVAPDMKRAARTQALAAAGSDFGGRELIVRVNALDTEWGAEDCAALGQAGFAGVLLPKVASVGDLVAARAAIGGATPIWAMIESCMGMLNLAAIVGSAVETGLACLIVGTNDLAKDMRATPGAERTPLLPHLVAIVTAARGYGLTALDGVSNVLEDGAGLAAECAQGAAFGFDGKSLIHPAQIAAANRAYAPSEARVAWAKAVVAAFALAENADKGAIRVDGEMVERLHLEEAERVLALI